MPIIEGIPIVYVDHLDEDEPGRERLWSFDYEPPDAALPSAWSDHDSPPFRTIAQRREAGDL